MSASVTKPVTPTSVLVDSIPNPKAGWKTSEFYLVVLGNVSLLLTLIFHDDWGLSNSAAQWATVAAFSANGAYALARSLVKAFHWKALGDIVYAVDNAGVDAGAVPVPSDADPSLSSTDFPAEV